MRVILHCLWFISLLQAFPDAPMIIDVRALLPSPFAVA